VGIIPLGGIKSFLPRGVKEEKRKKPKRREKKRRKSVDR